MERIGDARFVLLGEASHGTSEYYTWRAALSRRLIREKGFSFLAVEGDWPDCYRVNQFIKGETGGGETARDVLHAFARWPTWMWANEEVVALAEFLREENAGRPKERRVGFYGLDVYSLWESLYAIMGYLRNRPSDLPAALRAFHCFEPYGEDERRYAHATTLVPASCEDDVVALLTELRRKAPEYRAGNREAYFVVEQNAVVLKNAEAYYRAMVHGGPESWNIRDLHMIETLERLMDHHGPDARAIVWEHNTHIGDARFTDMAGEGMVNVGQLVRERHRQAGVVLVGFGSYQGSVIAARTWGDPMEQMTVPPAQAGSWEDVLHRTRPGEGGDDQLLLFPSPLPLSPEGRGVGVRGLAEPLLRTRGHRAIGVVYHPEYEQLGNYVPTVLPRRYDAFLFLDRTRAVAPLHLQPRVEGEVPETYPTVV
jgi:erythromycin esterase-like protein